MFVDRVKIRVCGGDGGRGCASFRREAFVPKGGPDGGDGGNGGDVIIETTAHEQSLQALRYLSHYDGERGQHGMGKDRHGRNGEDVVIKVPIGTIIMDLDNDNAVIEDMNEAGMQLVIAKGGAGGKGNARFASSTNRAPRKTTDPTPGEERHLFLELKVLADVGLVGYPNAGKSTLLGTVSNAAPETGAYPFTTLTPSVGVIEDQVDYSRFTIADIPGLIEGAHENVGLGHDFLRHIERTKILVYVLDTAGTDGREPWDDLESLQRELECYQPGMTKRPAIIVANKMDEGIAAEKLEQLRTHTGIEIFPVCAVLGEGTEELIHKLRQMLKYV
jgi:GTP-binding protein